MIDFLKRNTTLSSIYIGNLLLALHYYLIVYVNSSFLSKFYSGDTVSFIYAAGSFLNLILFLFAARIIRRIGAYHFLLTAVILEGVAIAGLIYANTGLTVGIFFTIHQIIIVMTVLGFDIFLEAATNEEGKTGRMRSFYLTISNAALVIAPAIVGLLVINDNYIPIYTISALLIVPLVLVIIGGLRDVRIDPPEHFEILGSLRGLIKHKNVRWATGGQLILQTFYAWMVIYTPIYLHDYIGFDWAQIGVMFTIMLLPFIILQIPVGKLADDKFGEKEFMIFGFIVIVVSLLLMPIITAPSFVLWTAVLFLSRVGASIVEVTNESYFFKQVAGKDSDWISLFRATRSVGYVIAPILAALCIFFLPYKFMFTVLAFVVTIGIFFSYSLVDTR